MKTLISLLFFFSILFATLVTVHAQDVRVSNVNSQNAGTLYTYAGPTADFSWNVTFSAGSLAVNDDLILIDEALSYDFSPDRRHLGVLIEEAGKHHIRIFNQQGYLIAQYSNVPDVSISDPSLKLYLLGNGTAVLRDNIVSFAIYTLSDLYVGRVSNSSGSAMGESVSRLASSHDGRRIIAYNPRVVTNQGFSSRISLIESNGTIKSFYFDDEREIIHVSVAPDGEEVTAIFRKDGDLLLRVIGLDGEVKAEMASPMEDAGYYVQAELGTITWFSGNAAQVYDIKSGERLANAFLRNQNIIFATYNPDDNLVVTLTGRRNYQNRTMNLDAVRVVDLTARSILHSSDINLSVNYTEDVEPGIVRSSVNRYRLTGVTNALDIQVR